jgi:CP family cyanate transporter-like MFS transporter
VIALVLIVGFNLRTPLLSVTPLLAIIHTSLGLNYSETGLLASLPSLVMGLGAFPAGWLVSRVGGRGSVSLGLLLVVLGTVTRGVWLGAIAIYVCTAALALGIALAQTALPLLARQWFPTRIGFITAIYTDGMVIGEAVAASVTVPLMRAWFGANAWPAALLVWAIPVTVALLLWMWLAPPAPIVAEAPRAVASSPSQRAAESATSRSVGPWLIGVIMSGGSVVYFGMNGWVASYNEAIHAAAITPAALFAINGAQLPVCIGLTFFAQRLAGKRWPFVAAGCVEFVSILGWLLTPPTLEPLWGALIGGAASAVFTLAFALPAIFGREGQVARLTGGSLGVSYTATFIVPSIGGVLWDTLHMSWLAFVPVAVVAFTLIWAGMLLPARPPQPQIDATTLVEVAD